MHQFGYTKVRFRELTKKIEQQAILLALPNPWIVRNLY
ncbi:hypothetical protein FHW68_005483 [Pseudomonas sp. Tn43]|nr:hypothetical protein [Pseudomonas sp. Tn43]